MNKETSALRKALIMSGRLDPEGNDEAMADAMMNLVKDFRDQVLYSGRLLPPRPPHMSQEEAVLRLIALALEHWTSTVLKSKHDPLRTQTEH